MFSPHFTYQIAEKKCHFCDETDDHTAKVVQEEQKLFSIWSVRNLLKWHQRTGFKSSEEKDIVLNFYALEHHRTQANKVMVNVRKISVAKTYDMTNNQPKRMFWYVMSTCEIQKMNNFFYSTRRDALWSNSSISTEKDSRRRYCSWIQKTREQPKGFATITTVCWGWHRFHVGNEVRKLLSRKSVAVTIWVHNIEILVKVCRWH